MNVAGALSVSGHLRPRLTKRGIIGGVLVNCDLGGAPSGWIGANN